MAGPRRTGAPASRGSGGSPSWPAGAEAYDAALPILAAYAAQLAAAGPTGSGPQPQGDQPGHQGVSLCADGRSAPARRAIRLDAARFPTAWRNVAMPKTRCSTSPTHKMARLATSSRRKACASQMPQDLNNVGKAAHRLGLEPAAHRQRAGALRPLRCRWQRSQGNRIDLPELSSSAYKCACRPAAVVGGPQ